MESEENLSFARSDEPESEVLYIVGTPIGNLNDISKRSANILSKVSFIACEDTRHTRRMLSALKINNRLISFHKHNAKSKTEFIISKLKEGESVGLVSDAGMPLISDPGEYLVKKARCNNLEVICSPGPCAALTGLVSSGLVSNNFLFIGFISRKKNEREKCLRTIAKSINTTIVYESPKRLKSFLKELEDFCDDDRVIHIAKELTKKHEQHWQDTLKNINQLMSIKEPKGEYTIIIEGKKKEERNEQELYEGLKMDLKNLIELGLKRSSAASFLANKSGLSKNIIYNLKY